MTSRCAPTVFRIEKSPGFGQDEHSKTLLGAEVWDYDSARKNAKQAEGWEFFTPSIPDVQVLSHIKEPSDMFAVADARVSSFGVFPSEAPPGTGFPLTIIGSIMPEYQPFRHGKAFNFLFWDGHVALIKRTDFLDPRKTAQNWNRDHEPHPETWRWLLPPYF